jgi:hypothetical protein
MAAMERDNVLELKFCSVNAERRGRRRQTLVPHGRRAYLAGERGHSEEKPASEDKP